LHIINNRKSSKTIRGGIWKKIFKNHENEYEIIEGELGISCSPKELVGGDVGLH